jgi:hypothetical protein
MMLVLIGRSCLIRTIAAKRYTATQRRGIGSITIPNRSYSEVLDNNGERFN